MGSFNSHFLFGGFVWAARASVLCTGLILVGCGGGASAPLPVPDVEPATLSGKLDAYLDSGQAANAPGIAVLVRKDGQVVYRRTSGAANLNTGELITRRTPFRLGSVSKPFTALAIMQLRDAGLLELDDTAFTYLPELPAELRTVTLRQLLTHTSGIPDYIDDNTDVRSLDNLTNAQLLALPNTGIERLEFAPGTGAEYSNTGYLLLAVVIERISGLTFPDYMRSNFFEPFGMTDSYVVSDARGIGELGEPVALNYADRVDVFGFNSLTNGSSGQLGSLDDLEKFLVALLDDAVVARATLQEMTKTYSSINAMSDYGLGWQTGTGRYWHTGVFTSERDFWHWGGFDGHRTALSIDPTSNLQIVVLTNGGEATMEHLRYVIQTAKSHYKR